MIGTARRRVLKASFFMPREDRKKAEGGEGKGQGAKGQNAEGRGQK